MRPLCARKSSQKSGAGAKVLPRQGRITFQIVGKYRIQVLRPCDRRPYIGLCATKKQDKISFIKRTAQKFNDCKLIITGHIDAGRRQYRTVREVGNEILEAAHRSRWHIFCIVRQIIVHVTMVVVMAKCRRL